jgi:hypothetical protein
MITRLVWLIAGFLFFAPAYLHAQGVITVEIQNVQLVRSLAGVVHDPADSPMASVLVEERSPDWKEPLRSTKTDAAGKFALAPIKGRGLYYLQLTMKGFNPLRVRVRVDPKRGKELRVSMEFST